MIDLSGLTAFIQLGFGHIVALDAKDHILFLVALAAIYRFREWRSALIVISAFTIGHSVTLALAVTHPVLLPRPALVEFLIPMTIVATGIENIAGRGFRERPVHTRVRVLLAGCFGLVHGAGFADYLRSLFVDSIALPLFGFNVGIELGQVVVLTAAFTLLVGVDRSIVVLARQPAARGLRLRVLAVSCVVTIMGSVWAAERLPW
jgi:hypothetical protein